MRRTLWCCAMACVPSFMAPEAPAAVTLAQMQSLGGAAHLHSTAARLFDRCGLPAAIVDDAREGERRKASWGGISMRLSALDWQIAYGIAARGAGGQRGWKNPKPRREACLSGLAWLALKARGNVGVVTTVRRPDGFGYVTTYRVSSDLFEAHKVVGLAAGLSRRIAVSALIRRYGPPDERLSMPRGQERHRYWVLTRNDDRPESLHAVDFEIDHADQSAGSYAISAMGTDFVDEKLASLLREWEKAYVLD